MEQNINILNVLLEARAYIDSETTKNGINEEIFDFIGEFDLEELKEMENFLHKERELIGKVSYRTYFSLDTLMLIQEEIENRNEEE